MAPSAEAAGGGRLVTSHVAARGLLALRDGDPRLAVELLSQVVTRDRSLGYEFDSAALELDLADALEAAGETAQAAELRARVDAFMSSLGCVHPL